MSRYIKLEDAIEAAINGCASWDGGYFPSMDDPIKAEFDAIGDKCIDLVRCAECKNWLECLIRTDNDGEMYSRCCLNGVAVGESFYCADGERRTNGKEKG